VRRGPSGAVAVAAGWAVALSACAGLQPAPVREGPPPAAVELVLPATGAGRPTLKITRVAHASVLIEVGDQKILTDPWFTESAAYHHGEPLGVALDQLPRLTGVLSSHGHYDHFDVKGFSAYPDKAVPMVVKKGSGDAARAAGFTQVKELDHWDTAQLGRVKVTATPAEHGVPENSYVLEIDGLTLFFGGDTQLVPELSKVAEKFPSIDLALLSVNGLSVIGGGRKVMTAEEAADLCAILKPKVAVPMHYTFKGSWFTDTFILSYDGTPERFAAAAQKVAPATQVRILEPGAPLSLVSAR
jgi:L-ascorbate metabolism protein UlaG (beta-lactamase superfamily)